MKIKPEWILDCKKYDTKYERLRCLYELGILDNDGFLTEEGKKVLKEHNIDILDIIGDEE